MKVSVVEQSLSISTLTKIGWKLAQEIVLSECTDFAKLLGELHASPPDMPAHSETPYFKGMMPRDVGPLIGKLLMTSKSVVLLLSDQHVYILTIDDAINDHHIIDVITKETFSYNTIDSTGPAFFQGRITKKTPFVAYLVVPPPPPVVETKQEAAPAQSIVIPPEPAVVDPAAVKKKRVVKKPKVDEEDEKIE